MQNAQKPHTSKETVRDDDLQQALRTAKMLQSAPNNPTDDLVARMAASSRPSILLADVLAEASNCQSSGKDRQASSSTVKVTLGSGNSLSPAQAPFLLLLILCTVLQVSCLPYTRYSALILYTCDHRTRPWQCVEPSFNAYHPLNLVIFD